MANTITVQIYTCSMDPFVAMALLVRGMDKERPEWRQITIIRREDRPEGGVEMIVK